MNSGHAKIVSFPRRPAFSDPLDVVGFVRSEAFELKGAPVLDVVLDGSAMWGAPGDFAEARLEVANDRTDWLQLALSTARPGTELRERHATNGWRFVRATLLDSSGPRPTMYATHAASPGGE